MIKKDNKRINSIYINGYDVISVYVQEQLIWPDKIIQKILSCYFAGYWQDQHPWTDNTPWTD